MFKPLIKNELKAEDVQSNEPILQFNKRIEVWRFLIWRVKPPKKKNWDTTMWKLVKPVLNVDDRQCENLSNQFQMLMAEDVKTCQTCWKCWWQTRHWTTTSGLAWPRRHSPFWDKTSWRWTWDPENKKNNLNLLN